jgi:hypothetical protein
MQETEAQISNALPTPVLNDSVRRQVVEADRNVGGLRSAARKLLAVVVRAFSRDGQPVPDQQEALVRFRAFEEQAATHVEFLRRLARQTTLDSPLRTEAIARLIELNRCDGKFIRKNCDFKAVASFRRLLLLQARRDRLAKQSLQFTLSCKEIANRFADALGADRPIAQRFGSIDHAINATALALRPVVLKPSQGAGSRGVFVVHGAQEIWAVKGGGWFSGYDLLRAHMSEVGTHVWLMEEFMAKPGDLKCPAPDLKFYCFYGRVGMVLEVERYPKSQYCWWSPEGARTETGKYSESIFDGAGFTQEHRALAERISAAMPLPFMRIDFLKAESRLLFGELTPRPGNFHAFNDETDRQLGDLYLEAEGRLMDDLLNLKGFPEFRAATGLGRKPAAT